MQTSVVPFLGDFQSQLFNAEALLFNRRLRWSSTLEGLIALPMNPPSKETHEVNAYDRRCPLNAVSSAADKYLPRTEDAKAEQ